MKETSGLTESFNVVLLPDAANGEAAIRASKTIAKVLPVEFILGNFFLPHVTVYQAEFPKRNLKEINNSLRLISKTVKPFNVILDRYSFLGNFIFWRVKKTASIINLHQMVLSRLNPLREGIVNKSLLAIDNDVYPGDKDDVRRYGSLLVGKNYLPHLTISCLKNRTDIRKSLNLLKEQKAIIKIDQIHLGLLREFGTVREIVCSWPLLT
ncbi:2'-5' RNA ligase family protein [Patescibacteria group bacterium]|nr:2'-5' RNA ligase family protein [Patescibacteria group bacterium]